MAPIMSERDQHTSAHTSSTSGSILFSVLILLALRSKSAGLAMLASSQGQMRSQGMSLAGQGAQAPILQRYMVTACIIPNIASETRRVGFLEGRGASRWAQH